jgi:hypothetical protein
MGSYRYVRFNKNLTKHKDENRVFLPFVYSKFIGEIPDKGLDAR